MINQFNHFHSSLRICIITATLVENEATLTVRMNWISSLVETEGESSGTNIQNIEYDNNEHPTLVVMIATIPLWEEHITS